jgi:hypothetical protein
MTHRPWLAPLLAASLLAAGCSEDSGTRPGSGDTEGPEDPGYVLLVDDDSDPDQVKGKPGAYALTARGSGTPPLAVLDVPVGWSNFGFFGLWPHGSGQGEEAAQSPLRAIQYWTVNGVHENPCRRGGEAAPHVGESVQELAAALAAQELTSTSKARAVTLDGHEGLYLERTVRSDIDVSACEAGYYVFWEGSPDDAHHTASVGGSVERTWILEVDGERVVLLAITDPGSTDDQAAELTAMVESVQFEES